MKRLIAGIVVLVCLGCEQEDILKPFTESQVVYLLTGGESKTWLMSDLNVDGNNYNFTTCQDSLRWIFKKASNDSIIGFELKFNTNCALFDTTFMGKLSINDIGDSFPDSLNFQGGSKSYVKPILIRPGTLTVSYSGQDRDTLATFTRSRPDLLSRQVGYYLTDGNESGDSLEWIITSFTKNRNRQPLITCSDSIKYLFFRNEDRKIQWNLLTPTNDCSGFTSQFFGTFSVSSVDGFFDGYLEGTGGLVNNLAVSSISPNSFSASYSIGSDSYSFICKAKVKNERIYRFTDVEELPIDQISVNSDWETSGWMVFKDTLPETDIAYSISKDITTFGSATLKCEIIGGDKYNSVNFSNEIAKNPKQSSWFFKDAQVISYSVQIFPDVNIDCEITDLSEVEGFDFATQHAIIPYYWKWAFRWSKENVWSYWDNTLVNGIPRGWISLPSITDCIEMNEWNSISFVGTMDNEKVYYNRLTINGNTYLLTQSSKKVSTSVGLNDNLLKVDFRISGDSALRLDHSEGVDPVTVFLDDFTLDVFD